eukprot:1157317-Pelagomonas_calceolata.AAC.5
MARLPHKPPSWDAASQGSGVCMLLVQQQIPCPGFTSAYNAVVRCMGPQHPCLLHSRFRCVRSHLASPLQAPDVMRSCSMAMCLLSTAMGSYLAGALTWAVQAGGSRASVAGTCFLMMLHVGSNIEHPASPRRAWLYAMHFIPRNGACSCEHAATSS